jgi:hypothetical protein
MGGKTLGKNNPGSTLVFLTTERIIVASADTFSIPLVEIQSISELVKGKLTWAGASGESWAFEHAKGIIRSNGNKENTSRFYDAMKLAVAAATRG